MNLLVRTWCASIFVSCVLTESTHNHHHYPEYDTKPTYQYDLIHGHRINNTISKESNASRERRYKFRKIFLDEVQNYKPEVHRFKDELTYSEQISRRPINPQPCRKAYVNSKNYTRKSVFPENYMCDSQFKIYGEDFEKEALASLERRFVREKKEREEKEALERRNKSHHHHEDHHAHHKEKEGQKKRHEHQSTTIHPMFRTRSSSPKPKLTTEDTTEIFTADSKILYDLESEQNKIYTGDSEHYQRLYDEAYKDVPTSESKSISSDYSSFEKFYDGIMNNTDNYTTPHYEWWTYDPNVTCNSLEGKKIDYDRALYSLKMSSILPANISAEVDAMYNQPEFIDTKEANRIKKSMEEWGKTANEEYNSNCGPIPERRELREPYEIMQNRYLDVEEKFGKNFRKDVKNYFVKPVKKGLYKFKHWMNKNYTSTTKKIALTWPEQELNDEQMVDMYKKYLKEEKNITVRDSAGHSIFRKDRYEFTADSNYYDETREDFPWSHHAY